MYDFLQGGFMQYLRYDSEGTAIVCTFLLALLCIVVAYLLGSINSAIIISKLIYRDDIRNCGSGNAGTTNMLRTYGAKAALFTLLGDIMKTVLAIFFAILVGGFHSSHFYCTSSICYFAGFFCILGHIFPVYYRFKGGKGVLCTATAVAFLSIKVFAVVFAVFVLIVLVTRYVSLGSCSAAIMYPFILYRFIHIAGGRIDGALIITALLEAGLIIYCHRKNIVRLTKGQESKIHFSRHGHKEKVADGNKDSGK